MRQLEIPIGPRRKGVLMERRDENCLRDVLTPAPFLPPDKFRYFGEKRKQVFGFASLCVGVCKREPLTF